VEKNLPPDHFYLAKVPNSGQFPVVDINLGFLFDLVVRIIMTIGFFTGMHTFTIQITHSVYEVESS